MKKKSVNAILLHLHQPDESRITIPFSKIAYIEDSDKPDNGTGKYSTCIYLVAADNLVRLRVIESYDDIIERLDLKIRNRIT